MTLRAMALAVLSGCALVLAGCGGGGEDAHRDFFIDTKGRLAVADQNSNVLRVIDLDSNQSAGSFTLANPPSALHASPGGRYVVAVQRTHNRVQFVDGGVWQEDHGDHLHDYKNPARMTAFQIEGPRPTHYDDRHGRASIFMDGVAGPPLEPSRAVLFDDEAIGRGRLLASLPPLPYAVHGFAEPNGDVLVVTHRSADAVDTLPNYLHVWRRSGETFVKAQELPTRCDRMHGSYTRLTLTVAGCADSVVFVRRDASGNFTSQAVVTGKRVSLVAGHPKQPRMIGTGSVGTPTTSHFFDLDPDTARASEIRIEGWSDGLVRRAHAFDRQGRQFFVLDSQGRIHVLEFSAGSWRLKKRLDGVIPNMPTAAPFPAFAVNGAKDELYVSDPTGRAIVTIDTAALEVRSRSALDFAPLTIAWTGITR